MWHGPVVVNGEVPEGFLLANCGRCGRPLLVHLDDVKATGIVECADARMSDCGRRGSARAHPRLCRASLPNPTGGIVVTLSLWLLRRTP